MTTTERIEQERQKARGKLLRLLNIEASEKELERLRKTYKDTESKELEIHLLWEKYCEL